MESREGGVCLKESVCARLDFDEATVQDETVTQRVASYCGLGLSTGCARTRIYVQHRGGWDPLAAYPQQLLESPENIFGRQVVPALYGSWHFPPH